ncbi:MAG TPA: HAD family phosphatase [Verrucomicrobiota bacterium]|nr:HAD family phosphatase [Verrucomicrobiota bacterium]
MSPAVVFDLGKVLLDFDYAPVLRRLAATGRASLADIRRQLDQGALLHAYERGELTAAEFHRAVAEATGSTLGYDEFAQLFADIFTGIPEMIALHAALRGAGVPTFIFSNTNGLAVEHVRRTFAFFNAFDGHVLSYEHGVMKPHARLYEVVEQLAGRRGAELVYLDDRAENVAAAAARGWRVVHHADPATSRAALRAFGLPA